MKKPKIRFKGYQEDWEQRKLGDVFEQTANFVNPNDDDIELWSLTVEDGLTPKSERYNREFLVKKKTNFKEVRPGDIVYNPMNMTLGAVGFNGMAKSVAVSGYYTTMVANKGYDSYYINTWLKSPQAISLYKTFATGSLKEKQRVQFPTLSIIPATFPEHDEQTKIGSYFEHLDHLITLHHRKYMKYADLSVFDWEQRKFGEIVQKYEDPVETPAEGYMRLGIRSHAKGTFHSYVEKGKELETAKMFRVAANNFIVNITFGWEHAVAITDESDAGKLVSHRFPQYSFKEGMNPRFFKYLILDECFRHHLELSSPGGAGRNRVLKLNEMLEYKMKFPQMEEQEEIAIYFEQLDNLITLHQRKCEETKTLKKYMLQKMFPQNGHSVPEIRFSGFTEDWEQRKFADVVDIGSGMDYKHLEEGNIPVYGTGGYLLSVNKALSDDKDAIGIGRKGTIDKPYILRAPFWTVDTLFYCIPKENYDLDFTSCIFQNVDWKKKDESTGVPSLSKVIINNVETATPTMDEQQKIGEYFSNLDHLITLHQHKCEELQNIKKFMLKNMFI